MDIDMDDLCRRLARFSFSEEQDKFFEAIRFYLQQNNVRKRARAYSPLTAYEAKFRKRQQLRESREAQHRAKRAKMGVPVPSSLFTTFKSRSLFCSKYRSGGQCPYRADQNKSANRDTPCQTLVFVKHGLPEELLLMIAQHLVPATLRLGARGQGPEATTLKYMKRDNELSIQSLITLSKTCKQARIIAQHHLRRMKVQLEIIVDPSLMITAMPSSVPRSLPPAYMIANVQVSLML